MDDKNEELPLVVLYGLWGAVLFVLGQKVLFAGVIDYYSFSYTYEL